MNINSMKRALQYFLCVLALISISACDGGLFGTGDGTPIIDASTDNMDGNTGESSTVGTSTGADGSTTSGGSDTTGTSTGDMMSGGSSNTPTFGTEIVFTNNSVTLSGQQRLVDVINTSSNAINFSYTANDTDTLNTDSLEKLLGTSGVAMGQSSNYVAINTQQSRYYIFNNSTNDIISVFGPAELDPNTATTLWVSDSATDNAQNTLTVETTALVTSIQTSDPSLVKVRIIDAANVGASSNLESMGLLSSGNNPGGIDVTFSSGTVNNQVSTYKELPAGQYEFHIGDVRFSEQLLELAAGTVYSIVILNADNQTLLVKPDSELTIQD